MDDRGMMAEGKLLGGLEISAFFLDMADWLYGLYSDVDFGFAWFACIRTNRLRLE